jgi:hypothetical protein
MRKILLIFMFFTLMTLNISCIPTVPTISTHMTENEKDLLFTFNDIADYMDFSFRDIGKCESFQKFTFAPIMSKYTYHFDSSKVKANSKYLNISCELETSPSVAKAKEDLKIKYYSFKIGFGIAKNVSNGKVKLESANQLFTLGDSHYHLFIKNKDSIIGNFILTRVQNKVLQVYWMGVYFNERQALEECLAPTVAAMRKFK